MTLNELKSTLHGTSITDVLLTGFLDESESPVRFCALLQAVYFELGCSLLQIATIGDSARASLQIVSVPQGSTDLDDDMVPAVASIRHQILQDPDSSNAIRSVRLWNVQQEAGQVSCSATCMELCNGQNIFVDPSNYFGIRIGGNELKEIWVANSADADAPQVELTLSSERP